MSHKTMNITMASEVVRSLVDFFMPINPDIASEVFELGVQMEYYPQQKVYTWSKILLETHKRPLILSKWVKS